MIPPHLTMALVAINLLMLGLIGLGILFYRWERSDREREERALRLNAAILSKLLESAPGSVLFLNVAGRTVRVVICPEKTVSGRKKDESPGERIEPLNAECAIARPRRDQN